MPDLKCPLFRFMEGFLIRIDGGDPSTDRLPLVPIAAATAPTIENVRVR